MKKTYIQPLTEVYQMLAKAAMLAGSGEVQFNSDGESGSGKLINGNAGGAGLGRSGFFDDDED
ncbi:MAG: hypothetical protein IJ144_02330 [Prevotella sp.]|nr:hypothetical protein [Prevotella sp.]